MLVRALRGIIRKKLQNQRQFVTLETLSGKHNVTGTEDIILRSPRTSPTYLNGSIDQFVWENLCKWGHKSAIVSDKIVSILQSSK